MRVNEGKNDNFIKHIFTIPYIVIKGGFQIGAPFGAVIGLMGSIAQNIFASHGQNIVFDVIKGTSAGVLIGSIIAGSFISKRVTFGLVGSALLIYLFAQEKLVRN